MESESLYEGANTDNFVFEVYYQGELLGKCKNQDRFTFLREKLTEDQLSNIVSGAIEFKLVAYN